MTKVEELASLYERDYLTWIEATVKRLQQQDYANVDWTNLIEEVASLGRMEKHRLHINARGVLRHLLQWQYQPEGRNTDWKLTLLKHRMEIEEDLEDSPSLGSILEKRLADIYKGAVQVAAAATGLPKTTFPIDCPYAIAQILDENFLPE